MIMDAKPTASEMLEWIFAHNVTVLEQASGGFACLYQALGGGWEMLDRMAVAAP